MSTETAKSIADCGSARGATPPSGVPGALLFHPVNIAALGVLILNDRVLKSAYPSWWTGKLSDCAGLVIFPLLLLALWEWVAWLHHRFEPKRTLALGICTLFTATIFSAINISVGAGTFYESLIEVLWAPVAGTAFHLGHAHHTVDPTDLCTLPFLGVPWLLIARR